MTSYQNFIGIDISKFDFSVVLFSSNTHKIYPNNSNGFSDFLSDFSKDLLQNSLCIIEATGYFELELLYFLCHQSIPVHRADTRKVKNFVRSYREVFKTDKLDAAALAQYGFERQEVLNLFQPHSQQQLLLGQLVQRRLDLKQMLVAEKNRLQAPGNRGIQESCKNHIIFLELQIDEITNEINMVTKDDALFEAKKKVLKTIAGIGDIIATELLILLPELGQLNRKQIASLVGLAPISRDSGRYQGYRRTGYGRQGVKPKLFLAAMAARNSSSSLKEFYETLISRGKKKWLL